MSLASCEGNQDSKEKLEIDSQPAFVVEKQLQALKVVDITQAQKYMIKEKQISDFNSLENEQIKLVKIIFENINFKIKDTTYIGNNDENTAANSDKALVVVSIESKDLDEVMEKVSTLVGADLQKFVNMKEKEKINFLEKQINIAMDQVDKMTETQVNVPLIKVENEWKIEDISPLIQKIISRVEAIFI